VRGERLFLGSCAGYCHSPPHGGRGDAPDLFDCQWLYGGADPAVFRSISEGMPNTDMRAFAELLSEADRWILVAWMRSQSLCE
jgi:mono/diheme cytochrome c family protein